jgi:hypothetical protein
MNPTNYGPYYFLGIWLIGTLIAYMLFPEFIWILFSIIFFFVGLIIGVLKREDYEKEIRDYNYLLEQEEKKKLEKEKKAIEAINETNRNEYLSNRLKEYHTLRKSIIIKFDKDQIGEIDLIQDNDFGKILKKHQSKIVEIDRTYIQKFVKISNFLSLKKKSIQDLYKQLFVLEKINSKDISEEYWRMRNPSLSHFHRLNYLDELIQIEIHTYESVIFHSISMVTALLKSDLITFYEIFESFDKLGIFNSNWENDITAKLSNIEDKFDALIDSIKQLENRIENSLDILSYTTETSFKELNKSVTGQLSEIGSSLKFNNILTGIQVYQTHKLNKAMKRLN